MTMQENAHFLALGEVIKFFEGLRRDLPYPANAPKVIEGLGCGIVALRQIRDAYQLQILNLTEAKR